MIEGELSRLDDRIDELKDEVVENRVILGSISKDLHMMATSYQKLETVLSTLNDAKIEFKIHEQEVRKDIAEVRKDLGYAYKRIEKAEAILSVVDKDHEIVSRLSTVFWKALAWTAVVLGGFIVSAMVFIAENGGFR